MITTTDARPRYRKISTRMWGDEKFRQLSKPKPNAQTLWFFLLTGPFTLAVPGLLVAGPAALAEALGWPLVAFRRAWREIEAASMGQADWSARVIWLPNAIRHNPPANPSVVRGWRPALAEVPECALKQEALSRLEMVLGTAGAAYLAALRDGEDHGADEPEGHRAAHDAGHRVGHHVAHGADQQEQDQDQDQETDPRPSASAPAQRRLRVDDGERFDRFWAEYPRRVDKPKARKVFRKACPDDDTLTAILSALQQQKRSQKWRKDDGEFVPYPATWLNGRRWEDQVGVDVGSTPLGERYVPDAAATAAYLRALDEPLSGEVA